jgi:hypothetical protein
MSEIKQAKNLEDMVDILLEAALSLRECNQLLQRTGDTASIMAAARSLESQGNVATLAQDLNEGLVDLKSVPFDQKAHNRVNTLSGLVLENEPERRDGHERRAQD